MEQQITTNVRMLVGPDTEPLTLEEVREHLRLVATGSPASHPEDALVMTLIMAARQYFDGKDGWLGRALITQQWELVLDRFPDHEIRIPLPPLQTVDAINYDDEQGVEQTVAPSFYVVDTASQPGWVMPVSGEAWPTTVDGINAVRVQFTCGYGDDDLAVPEPLRIAMKVFVAHLYQHRDDAGGVPLAVDVLAYPYRIQEFP